MQLKHVPILMLRVCCDINATFICLLPFDLLLNTVLTCLVQWRWNKHSSLLISMSVGNLNKIFRGPSSTYIMLQAFDFHKTYFPSLCLWPNVICTPLLLLHTLAPSRIIQKPLSILTVFGRWILCLLFPPPLIPHLHSSNKASGQVLELPDY